MKSTAPAWVSPLLKVYIPFCVLGMAHGIFLFFLRADGSFATTFSITQFLVIVNAIPGCMLSAAQATRSVFAIRSGNASTLRWTPILLSIHTVTFTATAIVLMVRTFPGFVPQNVASAVHICLQVPSSIAVIYGLVNYRRWLLEQQTEDDSAVVVASA
jgi:hypothetical protein